MNGHRGPWECLALASMELKSVFLRRHHMVPFEARSAIRFSLCANFVSPYVEESTVGAKLHALLVETKGALTKAI